MTIFKSVSAAAVVASVLFGSSVAQAMVKPVTGADTQVADASVTANIGASLPEIGAIDHAAEGSLMLPVILVGTSLMGLSVLARKRDRNAPAMMFKVRV